MITIYDVPQAQATLLKRTPASAMPIPQALLDGIQRLMGEALSPAEVVARILADVQARGDEALNDWTARLDGAAPASLRVPAAQLSGALDEIPADLRAALQSAAQRVEAFHRRQPLTSWLTQEMGGTLGQLIRPIRRVGFYIPAGTAPLFSSVLMSVIPARVAGVSEIVMVSPPQRGTGQIAAATRAAAYLSGVDEVYTLGGAQAIAALAYGTQTIRPVDKIVGPGNLFVTLAKQQVYGVVGIDGLAGPTETVVIADDSARPEWAAADLLAQAEHDLLASAILLTPSRRLAEAVQVEVERQLALNERSEILATSLRNRGGIVLTADIPQAIELSNAFGPEHLNLVVADPWRWLETITCAGGVFVGEQSYEVLGDYIAGPSHVMPTGGTARFASPLNVWDFVRIISLVALDPETARRIGQQAAIIARAEGLTAHARAAEWRQQP